MSLKYEPASEPLHISVNRSYKAAEAPEEPRWGCEHGGIGGIVSLSTVCLRWAPSHTPLRHCRAVVSLAVNPERSGEIGILLPNNQRQHRTLHIQKDVLPSALC